MMDLELYWQSRPTRRVTARDTYIYFDASTPIADHRARTLLSKEPSTIRWLDRMNSKDVLYDVGANVGVYGIYASRLNGTLTYAFEPDGRNFGLLCRNIALNELSEKLFPFCLAISNRTGPDILHARPGDGGESGHGLKTASEVAYYQGIMSMRLDDFAASESIQPPTMLKIDIDGLEPLVVEGLGELAYSPTLQGLNIELNRTVASHRAALDHLVGAGFEIDESLGFVHPDGVSENIFLSRRPIDE